MTHSQFVTAPDLQAPQETGTAMSDRAMRLAGLAALRLPLSIQKRIAGTPIEIDGQRLDTTIQFTLRLLRRPPGRIPTPEEERAEFDRMGGWFSHPPEPTVTSERVELDGPAGAIPATILRPAALPADGAPVVLFLHGGGYVSGSSLSHHWPCRQLAHEVNCAFVLPDYRLAPEHPFPAGIEDCLASYDAVVDRAEGFGFDPRRVAVSGDSAGGNAAAVIAQQRKGAEHPPSYQMLWVPWLDMSSQTRSYELMGEGFRLEKIKMEWYTDLVAPNPEDRFDPLASPLLGEVDGVAPAGLIVAGFDPLRDEGLAYAERLRTAGVPVDLHFFARGVHMLLNTAGAIPYSRQAFDTCVEMLRANV